MATLRSYIEDILKIRGLEPKTPPVQTVEDRVVATLFTIPTTPLLESGERTKRYRSIETSNGKDAPSRKKERTDLEAARRASFLD